jgi:hypothetical protein
VRADWSPSMQPSPSRQGSSLKKSKEYLTILDRPMDRGLRVRALCTSLILLIGTCLVLGVIGRLIIRDQKVVLIYQAAALGLAAWISRENYRASTKSSDSRSVPR